MKPSKRLRFFNFRITHIGGTTVNHVPIGSVQNKNFRHSNLVFVISQKMQGQSLKVFPWKQTHQKVKPYQLWSLPESLKHLCQRVNSFNAGF